MKMRTVGLAAMATLALGMGAAMAQEGANDTISGSTYFPTPPQVSQSQTPAGMIQSGSSDVQTQRWPTTTGNSQYRWVPGVAY